MFTAKGCVTHDRVINIWNSIYRATTVHMDMHKVTSKFIFLSCGVIGELLELHIFSQCLMSDIYTRLHKKNASPPIKHSVWTLLQMYHQHDGTSPHFCRNIMWYVNEQFSGCSSVLNWPAGSLAHGPSEYHVWCYLKDMVYKCKMAARYELLQWISYALHFLTRLHVP